MKQNCRFIIPLVLVIIPITLISTACQRGERAPTAAPMVVEKKTPTATFTLTVTPSFTPTPLPTFTPTFTATSAPTFTPEPTPTLASVVRLLQSADDAVEREDLPSDIYNIATYIVLTGSTVSDSNMAKLEEWMLEFEYRDAPLEVLETYRAVLRGDSIPEEAIVLHNEWVVQHNESVIPYVTATADARAKATATQVTFEVQATATRETEIAHAAQGVVCADLPNDELLLTSPVAEWEAVAAWMLGTPNTGGPEPWAVGFELKPGALVRAPISTEDYHFWGTGISNATGVGNRRLAFYKTIGENRYEVTLILPGKAEGDRFELLGPDAGRPPIQRGQAVARILTDEGLNRPFLNAPDGFDLIIKVNQLTELPSGKNWGTIEPLSLDRPFNTLWYGGYPTVCKEWKEES